MSTNRAPPDKRRKPEAVRKAALDIGRRLLIAGGPSAITLKAIGAEMGMTHPNLIHHFGSAEAFQLQLRDLMVENLTGQITEIVARQADKADVAAIVDQVFDAYATGGIGMLMAWSVLRGGHHDNKDLAAMIGDLVAAVKHSIQGENTDDRARQMVLLVTLLAFADSLIGKTFGAMVGEDCDATRRLTMRLLDLLGAPGDHAGGKAASTKAIV